MQINCNDCKKNKMIQLSGKDSFVIYQDTISKKNKIAIGDWHLFDFKKQISKPSFVCNVFNKETYFIDGEIDLIITLIYRYC